MKTKLRIELASIVALVVTILPVLAADESGPAAAAEQSEAIRPFHVNVPEETLVDLRRRITATRWPDRELANSFGIFAAVGVAT